ncbi:ATP-binding cassette domain-containing protein [Streptomyces sp. NPDC015346]|uniref:ABC transporter ATP-binding protein n=1 Tax=Streptomyces sp. NPDC015346 TaxID=3364954 RepID=UPI0036F90B10
MLQAIGLTSSPRRDLPPAVEDLTFEVRPGQVTALLGPAGSGKTTTLRLMLELEPGRGVTYFRGRPLRRIAHPAGEVGVLLGDVPGHPSRTLRSQLRMLCAATGVPATRADDMLRAVGLTGLHDQRIGTLSRGMDRRLGLASALLGDPHTLLLDEPGAGLSTRETAWLHELLRAHATDGGTVLYTTKDPKEAARHADRVITLHDGRLVADQDVADFARTRLRPRVVVRTPHAARLAAAVTQEARAARRSVEVVAEKGNRLSVYGSDCAEIGETAFRHGVLIHQLADEVGDPRPEAAPKTTRTAPETGAADVRKAAGARPADAAGAGREQVTPSARRRPSRSPLRPLRYEIHRLLGVPATPLVVASVLVASVLIALLLARGGRTPLPAVLAGWPPLSPLPPAALGAGLLGAFSFADEYRYPALTTGRGTVPRRLGLLLAKLVVAAAVGLFLAVLVVVADLEAVRLVYGGDLTPVPENWPTLCASWLGLIIGCAWAGVLGAGVFRVAAAGVAAVLSVPVLLVPLVNNIPSAPSGRTIAGLPARLRGLVSMGWPSAVDQWLTGAVRVLAQPVGVALALALTALLCAYLLTGLRRKARW